MGVSEIAETEGIATFILLYAMSVGLQMSIVALAEARTIH